jgi:flagellar P-ring protein precursor FlgI
MNMTKLCYYTIAILLSITSANANKSVKLKDLVKIRGVRENPVIGYGLVIGLKGSGDSGGEITNTTMKRMLQSLGLNPKNEITSKNVAAVIVTAQLPSFPRTGQKIDVTVSSIGDASSLAGGTLIVTPLKAGDGQVYAVANGQVTLGGIDKATKITTTARIPGGAVIEKEMPNEFNTKQAIRLSLNNPDFTNAARVAKTINTELSGKFATAKDSATIDLIIPAFYERNVVELIGIIENFQIIPDQIAKIVINEKTGTIVAGGQITLAPVAIAHKELTLMVEGSTENTNPKFLHMTPESATIDELVKGLNAIGASTEDLISIFQALKQNGALNAEIDII